MGYGWSQCFFRPASVPSAISPEFFRKSENEWRGGAIASAAMKTDIVHGLFLRIESRDGYQVWRLSKP